MRFYLFSVISFITSGLIAQCPSFSYALTTDVCRNQNVEISNVENGNAYLWDFCSGDIERGFNSEAKSSNNAFFRNRTIKLVQENGLWYAFTVSQTSSNIQRIDIGSDLSNIVDPQYNNLTNIDNLLSGPFDLDLIHDGIIWRGFIANTNNGNIIRLDFENGINNQPNAVDLGNFGGVITDPLHVLAINDGDDYFILVSNEENLVRINYGSDILNTSPVISSFPVSGSNTLRGLALTKECDEWVGLILSYSSNRIYSVDFGNNLSNTPAFSQLSNTVSLSFPANVSILNEDGKFYAFIQGALGGFYRYDFGASIADFMFTDQSISDPVFTSDQNFALEIVNQESKWFGFNFNLDNRELIQLSFIEDCSANISTTSVIEPSGLQYSSEGTYNISTRFVNSLNEVSYHVQSVNVSMDESPLISFNLSQERCISNPLTFTPTTPGLDSYNWDFDGDGTIDVSDPTGSEQSFDYSGVGTGTYTVRLDVSDGTCENFFEEEITIYDSPPAPSYTFSSPRTCVNTDFTFTNTTSDGGYLGPLEYLWEFIDEPSGTVVATANTEDVVYAFETEGQKTVRLTSSIPGCEEITEQTLMITPGPTALFNASAVCQDESMDFTNTSTGAVSFSWDFGDGFFSSAENPSHVYTNAGNYFVTLTATDVEGCEDTEVIEVSVSDSPQVNFDFDVPCTSSEGIQFFDLTTVDNADVISWRWFVNDVEVSTQQSPSISFGSTGMQNVRLDVQSSNGCESSYSEDVNVLSSPLPDFNINLGCQGENTFFTDNTNSVGNPIVSWLWTVDGVNYGTQDISHVFNEAGNFDVTLEVTSQNFCSETVTKSVEIIELPVINFSVSGDCDNQLIMAMDSSLSASDPIVSRRWRLDGNNVGNGSQLFLENLSENTYELALELETQAGCIVSSSQTLEINEAPDASFTASRTYGVPDDVLIFTNTSIGGVNYQWLLNGEMVSTSPTTQTIAFSESGNQSLQLVATNDLGCSDTVTREILIAIPEVDLSIGDFQLVDENGTGRIFLEIQNNSNLPVEITDVDIVLENQFSITEQILAFIGVGETELVNLTVGIPLTISEPSYFCVSLRSQYTNFPDINPINDERCITIEPLVQIEDPFPNPVTNRARVKVVSPQPADATIRLLNSSGKVQFEQSFNANEGLNNFFIEMSTLRTGIYFVTINILGSTYKKKIIKL